MHQKKVAGLTLCYEAQEQEAALVIEPACERSVRLIQERWGLPTPKDCRVYVMTAWPPFLFQSAPGLWKAFIALFFPVMAVRFHAIWRFAGGCSFTVGSRRVVGVKPPRLIESADRSLGSQIFVRRDNFTESAQAITCHELVHAYTFHLRLPPWLNEGLATLAMEYFLGRKLVREETLEHIRSLPDSFLGSRGVNAQARRAEDLVAIYARGYWLTRYLDENRPELVKVLLEKRHTSEKIEEILASALEIDRKHFWKAFGAQAYEKLSQDKC